MIRNRSLTAICALALSMMLFSACTKTETPAATDEASAEQAAAEATAAGEAAPANLAAQQPGESAPAGQPAATRPARQASAPAGSAASGWGDQPAQSNAQPATRPAAPAAPAAPVLRTYTVPSGATLRIRTTSTISTKSVQSGDTFAASLAEALEADGRVIAERGASVTGRIVSADPGGRVKGKASIALTLVNLELANGETVALDTSTFGATAESSTKKDAAKVAIGSAVGAAIGAIAGGGKGAAIGAGVGAGAGTGAVLATRGNDAVVPAETVLNFTTQAPISVKLR